MKLLNYDDCAQCHLNSNLFKVISFLSCPTLLQFAIQSHSGNSGHRSVSKLLLFFLNFSRALFWLVANFIIPECTKDQSLLLKIHNWSMQIITKQEFSKGVLINYKYSSQSRYFSCHSNNRTAGNKFKKTHENVIQIKDGANFLLVNHQTEIFYANDHDY